MEPDVEEMRCAAEQGLATVKEDIKLKHWNQALERCECLLAICVDVKQAAELWYLSATCHFNLHDNVRQFGALCQYEKLLADTFSWPEKTIYYNLKARALLKLGRPEEVLEIFLNNSIAEHNLTAVGLVSSAYAALNKYDDAHKFLASAIQSSLNTEEKLHYKYAVANLYLYQDLFAAAEEVYAELEIECANYITRLADILKSAKSVECLQEFSSFYRVICQIEERRISPEQIPKLMRFMQESSADFRTKTDMLKTLHNYPIAELTAKLSATLIDQYKDEVGSLQNLFKCNLNKNSFIFPAKMQGLLFATKKLHQYIDLKIQCRPK